MVINWENIFAFLAEWNLHVADEKSLCWRAKHNPTGAKEHPTLVLVDERMFTAREIKKNRDDEETLGRFEMATDSQVGSRLMFVKVSMPLCEFGAGLDLSLLALIDQRRWENTFGGEVQMKFLAALLTFVTKQFSFRFDFEATALKP